MSTPLHVPNGGSPGSPSCGHSLSSILSSIGQEANIDSILGLEKRIEEGQGDVIQLKRARNSLLNISTLVPPELLGQVFRWNVTPVGNYGNPRKGSYNFLLVCHHWFEVASGTPELWTYWGNTLKLWSRRYKRSGIAPLDLILTAYNTIPENVVPFDGPLRDALRDRATSDSIRSIHLRGDTDLLQPVIFSLILDAEAVRDNGVESLRLEDTDLDVSTLLSRYRFPRLRVLHLVTSARIASWDILKLQATSLTTLSVWFPNTRNSLTTSQLLLILSSYPNLQDLELCQTMIPHDDDESTAQVPLRRLKKLDLTGNCRHVFQLLRRLEHPDALDSVRLRLQGFVGEMASEFLEPYLRDRIQRDGGFQVGLGVSAFSSSKSFSFAAYTIGELNTPSTQPRPSYCPSVSFLPEYRDFPPRGTGEKLCTDLIAAIPREHVVTFRGGPCEHTMRDLLVTIPNVEDLHLTQSVVSDGFLQPDPLSYTKLFPSLRRLSLNCFTLQNNADWISLITYLIHQTSGGKAISLRLCGTHPPIPPKAVREIEGLVDGLSLGYSDDEGETDDEDEP